MLPEGDRLMRTTYFAHSANDDGEWDPLRDHLAAVAERARGFAAVFDSGDDAYLAGLLHDIGKYGDLFQERLKGREGGLDHWSMGASVCLERYRSSETAMAVQGHHVGLQWWDRDQLRKLLPRDLEQYIAEAGRRLTEKDRNVLLERLRADGLALPESIAQGQTGVKCAAAMFDLRMLYSALTDADYLATEEHFDSAAARMREPACDLTPARLPMCWIGICGRWPGRRSRHLRCLRCGGISSKRAAPQPSAQLGSSHSRPRRARAKRSAPSHSHYATRSVTG